MTQQIRYSTNEQIIQNLSSYLNSFPQKDDKPTMRPFNYFDPQFTIWWLVYAKEWPVYKQGKLFVQRSPLSLPQDNRLFTGFYVEKGLDSILSTIGNTPKKYITQQNWLWNTIARDEVINKIEHAVSQVGQSSDCPVRVYIASYESNNLPDTDIKMYPKAHDEVVITIKSDDFSVDIDSQATDELTVLNESGSIRDVIKTLTQWEGGKFFWLDFHIGVELQYFTGSTATWDASDIWNNVLSPWVEVIH